MGHRSRGDGLTQAALRATCAASSIQLANCAWVSVASFTNSCERLLALSGGALVVHGPGEDREETGASGSVRLVLPLAPPATILVVDDNQDALQLIQRYLAGTHYRPVVTRSPFEGLALAQELQPQAILLDVMLPGMDGWEMLARLRRHPATERIPVIICTILPEEQPVIDFAYATVVTIAPVRKGEPFSKSNIWVKRPGTGPIHATKLDAVLGRSAVRDIPADVHVRPEDIAGFA